MWASATIVFALASTVLGLGPIYNSVEPRLNTECKACPWSLCKNIASYGYDNDVTNLTLTCYTRGQAIAGDRLWLKTSDGCYVTQYDLLEYPDYEAALPYCGRASEAEFYKKQAATTKYNTECQVTPYISSDNVKYIKYGTDLTLTCYTEGLLIIDDSTWLKTTSNCYVAQIGLTRAANQATLEDCGPIPFLEVNYTGDYDIPPDEPERRSVPKPISLSTELAKKEEVEAEAELNKRFLISVHVGEDYALCHSEPTLASRVVKRYPFDQYIRLQCFVRDDNAGPNETYWNLSTDFCYVRSVDLWESPEGDNYRWPNCNLFV